MSNPLFDLFVNFKSTKIICTKLDTKYGSDNARKNKYVVGKWLQFQIMDDKPIMEQVHTYEDLYADVLTEGIKMCKILQANVLIKNFHHLGMIIETILSIRRKISCCRN